MGFMNIVGNSLGCSASGERLVSAARDGDLQEAKALLDYNPRLVKYSTFGVRNSPLHYSAAQGHHEIVSLLLETGVDINLRNYRGQTALMQACQHGHWEVVQTLIVSKANIHRADYLNGGTALHLAALNGHTQCIRLILSDYIPSIPNIWNILRKKSKMEYGSTDFNASALYQVINKPADGGITALHMAALNGHFEAVQLLLDLGASITVKTVEDGTTIDLIGAGSTALHYAACGGNIQCCQILIERGASVTAENANGCTPLMVARTWNRDSTVEMLATPRVIQLPSSPSPYLCLPMMSIIKIARDCGWRHSEFLPTCQDPCVVCLEGKCTVAAEGCNHEFCTRCALYLCTMNCSSSVAKGAPGSISCPLCRHGIVSFIKLPGIRPVAKEIARTRLSLSFCGCSCDKVPERMSLTTPLCNPPPGCSFRSLSCRRFPSMKLGSGLCTKASETTPSIVSGSISRSNLNVCSRTRLRRSTSHVEGRKSWFCSLNQYVATSG